MTDDEQGLKYQWLSDSADRIMVYILVCSVLAIVTAVMDIAVMSCVFSFAGIVAFFAFLWTEDAKIQDWR